MKKQMLKSALIALAGVGLMSGSGWATLINGDISLTGTYKAYLTASTYTNDLTKAIGIDFQGYEQGASDNTVKANFVDGDFSVLMNQIGTINDFFFTSTSVSPLWQFAIDNFTFDLLSYSVINITSTSLTISGTGLVSADSYEDTVGDWVATFNSSTRGTTFTWSSSTSTVPEPATMLLFGTGIVGLAGIARRKK